MEQITRDEYEKALRDIASMISRTDKVKEKLKEGSPQASLTRNRRRALVIASALITKELGGAIEEAFEKEDLEKALPPILSTIGKCEKVRVKLKEGTPQLTLTRNMLKALYLSEALLRRELATLG